MSSWLLLGGAGLQAASSIQSGKRDAAALDQQGRVASAQAYADEQTQRRQNRAFLGEQSAAIAESGVGPGTSDMVQRDSAIQAELDALNIRYKGQLQRTGLDYEAQNVRRQSRLLAGGQLLRGVSGAYMLSRRVGSPDSGYGLLAGY